MQSHQQTMIMKNVDLEQLPEEASNKEFTERELSKRALSKNDEPTINAS